MRNEIIGAFNRIMTSDMFRVNGPAIDLPEAVEALVDAVENEDDEAWYSLGECLECTLPNLIGGLYWSFSEWHGGQFSPEYRALSALGRIYDPGMTDGPENGSGEEVAYEQAGKWFQARQQERTK